MQVLDKVYKSKIVNKNGDGFMPKQLIDNSEKNMDNNFIEGKQND